MAELKETRALLRIAEARASAAERGMNRLIDLIRTKHGANACCYRTLSKNELRAWAFGDKDTPDLAPKKRRSRP